MGGAAAAIVLVLAGVGIGMAASGHDREPHVVSFAGADGAGPDSGPQRTDRGQAAPGQVPGMPAPYSAPDAPNVPDAPDVTGGSGRTGASGHGHMMNNQALRDYIEQCMTSYPDSADQSTCLMGLPSWMDNFGDLPSGVNMQDFVAAAKAALAAVDGAQLVTDIEPSDDADHAWDVSVLRADGVTVDVELNQDLGVVSTHVDN